MIHLASVQIHRTFKGLLGSESLNQRCQYLMRVTDAASTLQHLGKVDRRRPGVVQQTGIQFHLRDDLVGEKVALFVFNWAVFPGADGKEAETGVKTVAYFIKGQPLWFGGRFDGVRNQRDLYLQVFDRFIVVIERS